MQLGEAAGLAAALAKNQATTVAAIDLNLLVGDLVDHQFMVSFFNDVDVASGRFWTPAVEFFGTKGFFRSYDARADAPLTMDVAVCWATVFGKLANGEVFDSDSAARSLPRDGLGSGPTLTGAEFAKQLKEELVRRNLMSQPLDTAIRELKVDFTRTMDRGTACAACYKALIGVRGVRNGTAVLHPN